MIRYITSAVILLLVGCSGSGDNLSEADVTRAAQSSDFVIFCKVDASGDVVRYRVESVLKAVDQTFAVRVGDYLPMHGPHKEADTSYGDYSVVFLSKSRNGLSRDMVMAFYDGRMPGTGLSMEKVTNLVQRAKVHREQR